jgi:hypothetical protein
MSITANITSTNINTLEYNKFVEIVGDTNFPALTVTQTSYDDNLQQVNVYNKTAALTYDAGAYQVNGSPFGDNGAIDAFGRLRVSNPVTLLDNKFVFNSNPQIWDEEMLDGESTFVYEDSLMVLSTSASGGYVIRQTPVHFNYQPGKSLLVNMTGLLTPADGIIKRMGMFQSLSAAPFEPADGVYFEMNGTVPQFVIKKTSGTGSTITAPQSAWNIDRLNGTGSSGIVIDFNKSQILVLDYEWLGIGRVRFGFVIGGKIYYAHAVSFINALEAPYMRSPNQPVRYEIRQIGDTPGSMKQICSSVMVEGGEDNIGSAIAIDPNNNVTGIDTSYRPILMVRLKPTAHDTVVKLLQVDVFNTGNNDAQYKIVVDPVITGGTLTFIEAGTSGDAPLEYAVGSSTLSASGGYSIFSNFVQRGTAGGALGTGELIANLGTFGVKINGEPEILCIAIRALASTTSARTSVNLLIKG